jgi:hypothetical protein
MIETASFQLHQANCCEVVVTNWQRPEFLLLLLVKVKVGTRPRRIPCNDWRYRLANKQIILLQQSKLWLFDVITWTLGILVSQNNRQSVLLIFRFVNVNFRHVCCVAMARKSTCFCTCTRTSVCIIVDVLAIVNINTDTTPVGFGGNRVCRHPVMHWNLPLILHGCGFQYAY